jgi:hypothetical protein
MGGKRRACLACLAVVLLCSWTEAQADDLKTAREAYMRAEAASREGEHARAASEFERAYSLTKDPVLFYSIAKAKNLGGDCEGALVYYRRFLEEAKPAEKHATLATEAIAACERKIAEGDRSGAPEPGKDPGGEGGGPAEEGGGLPDPAPAAAGDVFAPPYRQPEPSRWMRTAGWITAGVTVALAVNGFYFGSVARERQGQIDELFADPEASWDGEELRRRYVELDRDAYIANNRASPLLISAAVTGAAAITFFVLDWRRVRRARRGDVALVPVVALDGGGISAGWEF